MTTYVVLSWIDPSRPGYHDGISATREYGSAETKQAAINLAERTLPPGGEATQVLCRPHVGCGSRLRVA